MIQEIKVKNFLSFKDETTLSFLAGKDTFGEETQVVEVAPGVRLLRFVALYGANASGKSNFLKVFDFLCNFWRTLIKIGDSIDITPFLFDKETPKQVSEFEILFYVKGVKYRYVLHLTKNEVLLEELYHYKNKRQTFIFSRQLEGRVSKIRYHSDLKISKAVKDELEVKCLKNVSFLAANLYVNADIPNLTDIFWYLRLCFSSSFGSFTGGDFKVSDGDTFMQGFLKESDFNIANFKNIDFGKELQTVVGHSVMTSRGEEVYYLPVSSESDGTKTAVGIMQELVDYCFEEQDEYGTIHILVADELENSLHPDLLEKILHYFLNLENNQNQMIVATHYSGLLETVNHLIRKDSVRFVEKKEDGGSEIYSLADFKGLEKIDSIYKTYREGRFGAVPNIQY